MIKIGLLIADRYEVLEKVGTGGMSDVYKAKDHRLNRMVAVKVLKQEFSENATFVSKFRVEAQAAAGLMHPNIVNVYDVGEEKGVYFIIMELVNGITLKRYIEKKKKLTPREAVTVAIQVAMGLAAAHRGHIIHRDIKPQNIIISKEGKVKVTDFGIAKASTSNTITSNVMGSVHYTSPEQARGGYSDEKSDVYSLGVTLYEMLTGTVPYDGDTTVAVALQHIQDPFPSPKELVPDLPYSVEQIVLKCCEKSPDRRYQTMDELAGDLRHSLNDPEGTFVQRIGDENLSDTRAMTAKDRDEIRRRTAGSAAAAVSGELAGASQAGAAGQDARTGMAEGLGGHTQGASSAAGSGRPGEGTGEGLQPSVEQDTEVWTPEEIPDDEDEELEEDERRLDKLVQILSVVAVLIVGIVIILVAVSRRSASSDKNDQAAVPVQEPVSEQQTQDQIPQTTQENISQLVLMPRVIGKTEAEAQEAVKRAGLTAVIKYGTSDTYADGIVMDSSVPEGERIEAGTELTLTVARTEKVQVPDVTGYKQSEAEKVLTEAGLVPVVSQIYSDETDKGYVESQDPEEGKEAAAGSSVTINVSMGPDLTGMVQVPGILGMTEQEAASALLKVGLNPGESTVTDTSGRYSPGTVIGQSIEKGEYVEEGTQVDMELSGEPRYSYSARIEAPRHSEDPDYKEGTPVTLTIEAEDGKELLNTTTSQFPYQVSFTGIPYSSATLYMTYTNIIVEEAQTGLTEEDSGSSVQREEPMEITRDLKFTKD